MSTPVGIITFLFTDIEGSAARWQASPAAMSAAVAAHDEITRHCVERHDGTVVKSTGDGAFGVFTDPLKALLGALELQRTLAQSEPQAGVPLRVRAGIHVGEATRRGDDYFGHEVNRAARIMSAAHGGQTLVSRAVVELVRGRLDTDMALKDLGHVRLRDLARPEHLYQVDDPELRHDFPPLRHRVDSATSVASRLPPLYGRDRDIEAVSALIEEHALVSIVGAGGIGKTRLAQAVAQSSNARFDDGACVVGLAALSDANLVVSEVARALNVQLSERRPTLEAIAMALQGQSILIVLDNCEHVLEAAATVANGLIRAARGVRVLVTSQESLKLADEHVFRVETLPVPPETDIENAANYGAIQLFVGRARAADPRFELAQHNVAAVVEVCRRLDGIPLALELAAARIPLLGIEGLRTRLGERFNVLTGGSRFVLRRHQTLRAALDFSHGLLSSGEQAVYRRLGVFAGSFGVESAQMVCADAALDQWEVLDCLGGLVDKSMVVAESGTVQRLRLLETTRAYALEKLAEVNETTDLLARHARAIGAQMSNVYDDYVKLSQVDWLARYEHDVDNLRAALIWASSSDSELAIALIGDSLKLWQELGQQPEALRYCEAGLALVTEKTPARAAGRLWYAVAMIVANSWPNRSRDAAKRAVALLRDANDPVAYAYALCRLAGWSRGAYSQEQLDALAELRRLENPSWTPQMRFLPAYASAMMNRAAGRLAEARRDFAAAQDFAAAGGISGQELAAETNVAETALMMGDVDYAIAVNRELAQPLALSRDRLFYTFALAGLTTSLLFKNDVVAAREAFVIAAPLILRYDLGFRYADTAALLAALEGRMEAAARMLGYSDAAFLAHADDARDPNEATARGKVMQRLSETQPAADIERWMRDGMRLSDEDAYRLALVPATAG